ncbi:cytochrome P450 [Roseateles saccharophilus]|uniref:Cytochrome P450 n=1 Tax=Roseateles saccharophilus TaxID=304 RepID=A0A4R3UJS2_ROSSA|nr:cytochrome P450 [Roseateles saccharophilus]MDG0834284.1 cytochrome P450 [Roseateles saccharophilus]TCU91895.1 cytochrome P450 [Roseateles saccharophilus]
MDSTTSPSAAALRHFDDLPGPRGVPVFGNLLQIDSTRVHQQVEAWCEDYGPLFKLRLGKRRIVVVGDHELIAAVLRDRPEGFRRTQKLEDIGREAGLGAGLFAVNGETWKRQRRMVMAGFDPVHVRRYYPALLRVAGRLVGRWQAAARAGRSIELQADLMRFTVDAVAGLAFGEDVNTLQSDEDVIQRHLNRIFPTLFKRIFAPLPTWRWWPSAEDRALTRSVAEINVAVQGFIAKARSRLAADPALREKPGNLLEAMLVAADTPASGIDDEQVAGNVLGLLLAGEDTTANTLAWMIWLLSRHPQMLARARAEVDGVLGDAVLPDLEQLGRLDFVEACAHETMRLRPVGPLNFAQAVHDTRVGDVAVPAGMVVMAVMRRDAVSERHLHDAAAFDPERWAHDAKQAGAAKRLSMPFGAGPRICPGRYLALMEIKLACAVLLRNFELVAVDTPDGQAPREHLQLSMGPVGLSMRLGLRA